MKRGDRGVITYKKKELSHTYRLFCLELTYIFRIFVSIIYYFTMDYRQLIVGRKKNRNFSRDVTSYQMSSKI